MDGTLKDEACCSDSFKRVMDCLQLTQGLQKVCIRVKLVIGCYKERGYIRRSDGQQDTVIVTKEI